MVHETAHPGLARVGAQVTEQWQRLEDATQVFASTGGLEATNWKIALWACSEPRAFSNARRACSANLSFGGHPTKHQLG